MYKFNLDSTGCISFGSPEKDCINNAPVGILVCNKTAYKPLSASMDGSEAEIQYSCGSCRIMITEEAGYVKITLLSVPEGSDGFIFGPYETVAGEFGEILGAGWYDDGSVVCIQSLMPKVVEGAAVPFEDNKSGISLDNLSRAAISRDGKVYLQVSAIDMSREVKRPDGFVVKPVRDEDASVCGAAVALLYAESAEELLDLIGEMELAEGLPHPLYGTNYAKKDPRCSSTYIIFGESHISTDEMVELACRAHVSCVYFSDIFTKWGHFAIKESTFPNGVADVRRYADKAAEKNVIIGAHSLTNFITTNDEYITPVPHKNLQIRDTTVLTAAISADDTEIRIAEAMNYGSRSTMNTFRIGDELIRFGEFDAEALCLKKCERGAFGTAAVCHDAGDNVCRLCDHGYRTFFPDIDLQDEMADHLGNTLRDCGILKLSFDGLEGCDETGYPEYARNRFAKRVCDTVGNHLLCDGSDISNYLWHAFSYCNWGEPWYDHKRRGGVYTYRYMNTMYHKKNLLPPMLGWYHICLNRGRYEATSPQNMEYMLSRNAAFRAGSAFSLSTWVVKNHGLIPEYMDMIRIWNQFRLEGDISEEVYTCLQEEMTDWHLEETEDGWILTQLLLREQDLDYSDRVIETEAGHVGVESESCGESLIRHYSTYPLDAPYPEFYPEPLHVRIRVGEPGHGSLSDLELYGALKFDVHADGGDYLEYKGGMELYRYDCNFNLLETITGKGVPIRIGETPTALRHGYTWGGIRYTTGKDSGARYMMTEIRKRRQFKIFPKNK